jgi:hypothetical protein
MAHPDVVYVVRPGDVNEELRYSLRSLRNVPHGRVFMVGHTPPWVRNVESVDVKQIGSKWKNSTKNMYTACVHPEISDDFIYMNDDMFVLQPISRVGPMNRGPIDEVIAEYRSRLSGLTSRRRYLMGMQDTALLLQREGFKRSEILSYELHVPMMVNKQIMTDAIKLGWSLPVLHKRTVYGNLAKLGGIRVLDVKVCEERPSWSPQWPFISTDDKSFRSHPAGEHVRSRLQGPSEYEIEES